MVGYVAVECPINRAEAEKCLVPFGYRYIDGILERPSQFAQPDYAVRAQHIEDKLRRGGKTIEDQIREMIVERLFLKINPSDIDCSKDITEKPLGIDSVQILEIVVGLEEEYEITLEDDEFDVGNFLTVDDMAEYVRAKLGVLGKTVRTKENSPRIEIKTQE